MIKTLIIDTNVIFKYPQLISLPKDKYKVIVPDTALEEYVNIIKNNEYYKSIDKNINSLKNNSGFIVGPSSQSVITSLNNYNISINDKKILTYAKDYSRKIVENLYFVTEDNKLIEICKKNGIAILAPKQIIEETKSKNTKDYFELLKNKNIVDKKAIKNIIVNIITTIVTAIIINIIIANWKDYKNIANIIIKTINIWGTIIIIPVFGVFMFWFKSHFRLLYGILEFVIGITTSIWVFIPKFDVFSISLIKGLQLMGGIYIIVRGMDNISVGLKTSPFISIYSKWKKYFNLT